MRHNTFLFSSAVLWPSQKRGWSPRNAKLLLILQTFEIKKRKHKVLVTFRLHLGQKPTKFIHYIIALFEISSKEKVSIILYWFSALLKYIGLFQVTIIECDPNNSVSIIPPQISKKNYCTCLLTIIINIFEKSFEQKLNNEKKNRPGLFYNHLRYRFIY